MPTDHPNVTVEDATPDEYHPRTLAVDFLSLDCETCRRCGGTEEALRLALDRVGGLLADLGVGVVLRNVRVETAADARRTALEISPTVRVDGRDVQPDPVGTPCESCGELAGRREGVDDDPAVDCRSWRYRGEEYATPPVELLVEEILRAALAERASPVARNPTADYRVPQNLRRFFGASASRREHSTGESESDAGEPCCRPAATEGATGAEES